MNPVRFAQCNVVLRAPPEMDDCVDLHVAAVRYEDGTCAIVSAWLPAPEELAMLCLGQPVYLSIIGERMPPVAVMAKNPLDFEQKNDD